LIWHSADIELIRLELNSDLENGLTAADAAKRLEVYGKNQSNEIPEIKFRERLFRQIRSLPVAVLFIAAVISLATSVFLDGYSMLAPILTIVLLVVNSLIGAYLERKSDHVTESMLHMTSPKARVIRDGRVTVISATDLVPGDIILVEEGDYIPADARLIAAGSLRCNEKSVTGESVVSQKDADVQFGDICPVFERKNIIFEGTRVTSGSAKAIVVETGKGCEHAKLEAIRNFADKSATPVKERIKALGKTLNYVIIAIAFLVFILGIFLIDTQELYLNILNMFTTSVALTVAAVPDTLAVIVSVVYAYGIMRMVKKKAVIKKFSSLETLGKVSVICADKTGTLTANSMEVKKIFDGVEIISPEAGASERVKTLLTYAALCSDSNVYADAVGNLHHNGDPTETGIIAAAMKVCVTDKHTLENTNPRICEVPFDGQRKLMTTVNMINGRPVAIVRGSTDKLLPLCVGFDRESADAVNDEMAKSALRVIAIGYKLLSEVPTSPTADELECGLTFMGMLGLKDSPRKDLDAALTACRTSGIKTVMITGDHITAAAAAAKQLGILGANKYAVTGEDLSAMSDEELRATVDKIAVYSRISPQDKVRIVRAWQARGHVVALTGDGVNDAMSLRAADVGCAMGSSGTDVARVSADVTLKDDNFATIVNSISYSRSIYSNIRRVIQYLLGSNLAELLTLILAIILFRGCPLSSLQFLLLTILTKSIPAIALGLEPPSPDIMRRPPREKESSILSKNLFVYSCVFGVMISAMAIVGYAIGAAANAAQGATMAFAILAIGEAFSSQTLRSRNSILKNPPTKNLPLMLASVGCVIIVVLIMLIPVLSTAFGLVKLEWYQWLITFALSSAPILLSELAKVLNNKFMRKFY